MSLFTIESINEANRIARKIHEQTTLCTCPDDPHHNLLHDFGNDCVELLSPIGMRADGRADWRVEAGAVALREIGVNGNLAWKYADIALWAAFKADRS